MTSSIPVRKFRCLDNKFHEDVKKDVEKIEKEPSSCEKINLIVDLQFKILLSEKKCCIRPFYRDSVCIFTQSNKEEIKRFKTLLSNRRYLYATECEKEKNEKFINEAEKCRRDAEALKAKK